MWVYTVKTGELHHATDAGAKYIGNGYSGRSEGLNNPSMETVHGVGPLPRGLYIVGDFQDEHPRLGKFVAPLEPAPSNRMYGRSEFFIHGDNSNLNHTASEGCVILPRVIRDQIARSGDKEFQVV